MKKNKKALWGWVMYDVANSAYWTSVVAGFFPIFFSQFWAKGLNVNIITARLGFANSLAALLLALCAPILGAIADAGFLRKKLLLVFAYLGVVMCCGLFFVGKGQASTAMVIYILTSLCFVGSGIFYNSLLTQVSQGYDINFTSTLGYSFGYLGGGLLFLVNVIMVLKPGLFGLASEAAAIHLVFLFVAIWIALFTLFPAFWIPSQQRTTAEQKVKFSLNTIKIGWKNVFRTFKHIRQYKMALRFLIAYWLYIDGVGTIIIMAVNYGLSIGFKANDLILALLLIQFIGFPCSFLWGKIARVWGVRNCIYVCLAGYTIIVCGGTLMKTQAEFFFLSASIGLFQGGIQALSRSYFSLFIPQGKSAEFFGFYNLIDRFAAIIGPFMMGSITLIARGYLMPFNPSKAQSVTVSHYAARFGISSIIILFILGAVAFYFVKTPGSKLNLDV